MRVGEFLEDGFGKVFHFHRTRFLTLECFLDDADYVVVGFARCTHVIVNVFRWKTIQIQ